MTHMHLIFSGKPGHHIAPGFFAPNTQAIFFRKNSATFTTERVPRDTRENNGPRFFNRRYPRRYFFLYRAPVCTGKATPGTQKGSQEITYYPSGVLASFRHGILTGITLAFEHAPSISMRIASVSAATLRPSYIVQPQYLPFLSYFAIIYTFV